MVNSTVPIPIQALFGCDESRGLEKTGRDTNIISFSIKNQSEKGRKR